MGCVPGKILKPRRVISPLKNCVLASSLSRRAVDAVSNSIALSDAPAIEGASDHDLMQNWQLLADGQVMLSMPRASVLRVMVMNHMIHHRGQLMVYYRLNGVPVPGMYGASADEGQAAAA